MPNTVRLHRVLATSPEKVYRAFLEADALAKWLPPGGFACTVHHLQPKVGGTFKMSFRNFTTGNSHSFHSEYVELVPKRTGTLYGQVRRSQPGRRYPGDGVIEESIGRHRTQHRAGRPARNHTAGGLLSRLARVAAKLSKARRTRDQPIMPDSMGFAYAQHLLRSRRIILGEKRWLAGGRFCRLPPRAWRRPAWSLPNNRRRRRSRSTRM